MVLKNWLQLTTTVSNVLSLSEIYGFFEGALIEILILYMSIWATRPGTSPRAWLGHELIGQGPARPCRSSCGVLGPSTSSRVHFVSCQLEKHGAFIRAVRPTRSKLLRLPTPPRPPTSPAPVALAGRQPRCRLPRPVVPHVGEAEKERRLEARARKGGGPDR